MHLIVGTSGYSYKEWKGTFYPAELPASDMLSFYAARFRAVEINNTFYRMPTETLVANWAAEVPDRFTFVLKAPQWITHRKVLVADAVRRFVDVAKVLGSKLGPLMFRMPPQKDVAKLRELLALVPREQRVTIEFRDDSWSDDEVHHALRDRDAALCVSDTDDVENPDELLLSTASWGYLRLRRTDYSGDELDAWRRRIEAQPWTDAHVFFKHEDEAKGPAFAKRFLAGYPSAS
jgi:uncharacterized protein YecE (DUF72 family)